MNDNFKNGRKKGFTLVEMLVVIAIIAILVSILVPTVMNATEKARESVDMSNIRNAMSELNIASINGEHGTGTATTPGPISEGSDIYYYNGEYRKAVYVTQKSPKWQSNKGDLRIVINGANAQPSYKTTKMYKIWMVRLNEENGKFAVTGQSTSSPEYDQQYDEIE